MLQALHVNQLSTRLKACMLTASCARPAWHACRCLCLPSGSPMWLPCGIRTNLCCLMRACWGTAGVQGLPRSEACGGVLPQRDQQRRAGQQMQTVHGAEQPAQGSCCAITCDTSLCSAGMSLSVHLPGPRQHFSIQSNMQAPRATRVMRFL